MGTHLPVCCLIYLHQPIRADFTQRILNSSLITAPDATQPRVPVAQKVVDIGSPNQCPQMVSI